jgi:hypothetical protein
MSLFFPTPHFPLPASRLTHPQIDAELCGALLQQVLVGDDDEWNIRRRIGKLYAQIRANAGGLAGGDCQWCRE